MPLRCPLNIRKLPQNSALGALQVLSPFPLLGLKTRACFKYRLFFNQNYTLSSLRQYLQLDFFYSRGATHRSYLGATPLDVSPIVRKVCPESWRDGPLKGREVCLLHALFCLSAKSSTCYAGR